MKKMKILTFITFSFDVICRAVIQWQAGFMKLISLISIKNLKIRYKIFIVSQFMMIPAIMIFIVLLVITHKMQHHNSVILIKNLTSITAAYNVENSLLSLKELKANYMLTGEKKWLREFNKEVEDFNYWYNQAFQVANTEEERDILSIMSLQFSSYMKAHKQIIFLADTGKKDQAIRLLLIKTMEQYNSIYKGCEDLISISRNVITESEKKLKKSIESSMVLAYVIIICFITLGVILVVIITRSIVDPINEIELASSNLLPVKSDKIEMERLRERFEMMIEALKSNQQKLIVSERRAAVGEIAAGISHELNNPIGIICGFAEILMNKKNLTDSDMESIEYIHNEAVRCKKLLGDLLDFARKPAPCYIRNNLRDVIGETVNLLKNQEKYKNVSFNAVFPENDVEIEIDAVQIKQVFLNMIINSCEAMEYRGRLDINLSYTPLSAEVRIKDEGPGIKEDEREKIFTPFYTTKTRGGGLGLAICGDIIEKHNGSIEVGGEPGRGAEFVIKIPRDRNEKQ
jgi:signal transduction histidine kinase